MSLWSEVHRIALEYPEGPPKPIAQQFLSQLTEEALVDLVADAILTARRQFVRAAEQEAFAPLPPEAIAVEGFDEHITATVQRTRITREEFHDLLDRTFAVGDRHGTVVRWGEATVVQHRSRIDLLQGQVRGTLMTIDRHREAIRIIEHEQVTCLNDAIRVEAVAN